MANRKALLEPNRPAAVTRPTGDPKDRRSSDEEPKYGYQLTADRHAVTGAESVVFTLSVFEGKAVARRVEADIAIATITAVRTAVAMQGPQGKVQFRDDGKGGDAAAGDRLYTATFVPAEARFKAIGGSYVLNVDFTDPTGIVTSAKQPFLYTPEEAIPARFTGKFKERLENGSLIVQAGLDVKKQGEYIINANLFDRNNHPVAHTTFRGQFDPGSQWVDLLFFGKVLRDQGKPGPYFVRDLRGYRTTGGQAPGREQMPDWPEEYKTRAYSLDKFSGAEWKGTESGGVSR
jgi:hypothetical protein